MLNIAYAQYMVTCALIAIMIIIQLFERKVTEINFLHRSVFLHRNTVKVFLHSEAPYMLEVTVGVEIMIGASIKRTRVHWFLCLPSTLYHRDGGYSLKCHN